MANDLEAPLLNSAQDDADCVGGVWSRPAAAALPAPASSEQEAAGDKRSLAASLAVLVLALPALVGSWCWPLLLAGFMGIAATAGSKAISHTFSLALTFAILTNLAQYFAWKGSAKSGTRWQRFGPAYLLLIATPLACADMTRHCLQDAGIWTGPSSRMYRPHCGPVSGLHGILCLSTTGWLFSILFTYSGFALMVAAVWWSTNLGATVRTAWRNIRR